ncbi:MAG: UvrD-helicase domain-containing protein [Gemmataceae bacterium]|nr:UvrD-helicase domain-containing protein [Gemmataceae bacterium]
MRSTRNFAKFNPSQRHALDGLRNLAVRAGAGSGKTSVLVERIVQLLAAAWDEGRELRATEIVAITFTRKAATALLDRLREAFADMASGAGDANERDFWTARGAELPHAMIGTIDSFCIRILHEFGSRDPSPDRLDAGFEPLDNFEQRLLQLEAIDRVINRLSDPAWTAASVAEQAQGEACEWWATTQGYEALIGNLGALLDHMVEPETIVAAHRGLLPAPERVEAAWQALPGVARLRDDRESLRESLVELIHQIDGIRRAGSSLVKFRQMIGEALAALNKSGRDADRCVLDVLRDALLTKSGTPRTRGFREVADRVSPLQETWGPLTQIDFDPDGECAAYEAADRLVLLLQPVAAQYLELCREVNRYDFLTIARHTRNLFQSVPEVGKVLKGRYRYVHVDEFQDTNRLQWEILSWIVGSGPDGALDADRLFIVGDPQQSIYRFRHADVSVFERIRELICDANRQHGHDERPTQFDAHAGTASSDPERRLGLMPLAENYRSLQPMPLLLMNRVFQHVFDADTHGLDRANNRFEVQYQDLLPGLQSDACGEVYYLVPRADDVDDLTDEFDSEAEAARDNELGRLPVRAVVDQLIELHGKPKLTGDAGAVLAWHDMAILLPSRTIVLTRLERELTERNVPFIVTRGIGFWQRQEVRDVVSLATWLADPGDELALFAVLRGPLGGLTDTEILFLSQCGHGSLKRSIRPGAATQDNPALVETWNAFLPEARVRIQHAIARLCDWQQRTERMTPSSLLQRALDESAAHAVYAADSDGERALANLDRLWWTIRQQEDRGALGLASLARWLRRQVDDSPREEQATLAPGQDAVQIMTVHAAKGLEFPVVALMKMERKATWPSARRLMVKTAWDDLLPADAVALPPPAPCTVTVVIRHPLRPRQAYTPTLLLALRHLDDAQQLAESRRLFYVAATRAQERLILVGKDGRLPRQSWQTWLEQALALTDEHRQNGLWADVAHGFRMRIVTEAVGGALAAEPPVSVIDRPIHVRHIAEHPLRTVMTVDELESMRQLWHHNPGQWWLRFRAGVQPRLAFPGDEDEAAHAPTVATLARRALQTIEGSLFATPKKRRTWLEAMAANIPSLPATNAEGVAAAVDGILRRLSSAQGQAMRRLLEASSLVDVDFKLDIGCRRIHGCFDSILQTADGWELVQWSAAPETLFRRPAMSLALYPLALHRTGRAARREGKLRVRRVRLMHGRIEEVAYSPMELDAFARELEAELDAMDRYEPSH